MKVKDTLRYLSSLEPEEELVCVWFTREDFPLDIDDDGDYVLLDDGSWSDVVSVCETSVIGGPLEGSWSEIHKRIYGLVGDRMHAGV